MKMNWTHGWTGKRWISAIMIGTAIWCAAGLTAYGAATNRYVSRSGSHTPPFTNWATAGTNIIEVAQAANNNAAGDVIGGIGVRAGH